jgi:hypothetical protein
MAKTVKIHGLKLKKPTKGQLIRASGVVAGAGLIAGSGGIAAVPLSLAGTGIIFGSLTDYKKRKRKKSKSIRRRKR